MTQKTVYVAILRNGKLSGKAEEDVQARIAAATAPFAKELERIKQAMAQAPASPSNSGPSVISNGNGTITIRTA